LINLRAAGRFTTSIVIVAATPILAIAAHVVA
jgi:hypothetical protein